MPKTKVPSRELGVTQPIAELKAELFRALAHPARIRVLEVLAGGERSVGEIQRAVELEASHLSQQLAVLRRAGVVTTRKQGSSVIYAVKNELVVELLRVARSFLVHALSETSDLLSDLQAEA